MRCAAVEAGSEGNPAVPPVPRMRPAPPEGRFLPPFYHHTPGETSQPGGSGAGGNQGGERENRRQRCRRAWKGQRNGKNGQRALCGRGSGLRAVREPLLQGLLSCDRIRTRQHSVARPMEDRESVPGQAPWQACTRRMRSTPTGCSSRAVTALAASSSVSRRKTAIPMASGFQGQRNPKSFPGAIVTPCCRPTKSGSSAGSDRRECPERNPDPCRRRGRLSGPAPPGAYPRKRLRRKQPVGRAKERTRLTGYLHRAEWERRAGGKLPLRVGAGVTTM